MDFQDTTPQEAQEPEKPKPILDQVGRALESMACAGLQSQAFAGLCLESREAQRLVLAWNHAYGRGDVRGCAEALVALQTCQDQLRAQPNSAKT